MKNYSKYGMGWFKESERHRLARLGVKTGRKSASESFGLGKSINYAKEDISKENFEAYEKVRESGVTNMFDVKTVGMLSGLQKEIIFDIMKNYGYLRKKYPGVRKEVKDYAKKDIDIKTTTITKYTGDDFEFTFLPVDDTINIEKRPDGYIIKYLSRDENAESPDTYGDESLFLVHYHRDFDVRRKDIITEDDARNFYQGNKIEQEKDYWIIPIESYIHGGVSLAIQSQGDFPDRRWDVSNVGLALASKEGFKTRKRAEDAIKGLIESWNHYLSGDVYSIVAEKYNKDKEQVDYDVVGGYSGYDDTVKELKSFKYEEKTPKGQKKIIDFKKK